VTAAGSSTCPCSGPGTPPVAGNSTGSLGGYLGTHDEAAARSMVAIGFRRGRKVSEILVRRCHLQIGGVDYY